MSTPSEAETMISGLNASRVETRNTEKPVILWEPQPDSCTSGNLLACLHAAQKVDVFSPNHIELARLYGLDNIKTDNTILEELATEVIKSGIGQKNQGLLALRAGDKGCLIASQTIAPVWVPAFVNPPPDSNLPAEGVKVIDPTGCGNAFLGAFAFGLAKTRNPVKAGMYGNVAARFVFEQIGVPTLKYEQGGSELWNNVDVQKRFAEYITEFNLSL